MGHEIDPRESGLRVLPDAYESAIGLSGLSTAQARKMAPPDLSYALVERPRLIKTLSGAMTTSLTSVVAGAGFGKTTLLACWAKDVRPAWYTIDASDSIFGTLAQGILDALKLHVPDLPAYIRPAVGRPGLGAQQASRAEALAAQLSESLQERLASDLVLVLDDLQEIDPGSASPRLIESLCRQAPARLHMVLASRRELPFSVGRLRRRGPLLEMGSRELAFTEEEVAALLDVLEVTPGELVEPLLELTNGWPAAVRLAGQVLRGLPLAAAKDVLATPPRRGAPLYSYLAEEVIGSEDPQTRRLLQVAAALNRFTPELCEELGITGAQEILAEAVRKGLFVETAGVASGWYRLITLIKKFLQQRHPLKKQDLRHIRLQAARWFEADGDLDDALEMLIEAGQPTELAALLGRRGDAILDAGGGGELLEAADLLPDEARSAEIEFLAGRARAMKGDWEGALKSFKVVAGGAREQPPGLAWRIGLIHYFRGEAKEAMKAFARGRISTATTGDEALLLAWTAAQRWIQGDVERCREDAELALEAASRSGDLSALAAAHTTLGMLAVLDGDRSANAAHYSTALDAAERAGDLFQVVRIRNNRASHLLEEGWYEAARKELDLAIRLGEIAGFIPHLALALHNRASTWYQEGQLERAAADFQQSRLLYERLDSRRRAYPLYGLGDVYRERGDLALARASYEEAIQLAEPVRDLQGLVPALAGLARVAAVDDPEEAAELCERALSYGTGLGYVQAVLARGWVALAAGDQESARVACRTAAAAARRRRDRAGLAEALELQALSSPAAPQLNNLQEAIEIWRALGSLLGEAKVDLALARLSEDAEQRARIDSSVRRLEALGVKPSGPAAVGLLAAIRVAGQPRVAVRTLGKFQVERDGHPIPKSEWSSKKARDILKILVAERGRTIHREALMEALWPGEDPGALGPRLSVALTGLRSALDPERAFPQEHYVRSDRDLVALNTARLEVDLDRFLAHANRGLRHLNTNRAAEAIDLLETAEAMYTGEFLQEDLYEEWATMCREEARISYIAVTRALGEAAGARGDHDAAARYLLRVLERDPYDEEAHLRLVSSAIAARRHGEARRIYGTYVERMREIGVEPAPFPVNIQT